ncbi:MAG: LicD family protein [Clostridia bacterium]|nr:LicD family protein [Clostridia bacterium]
MISPEERREIQRGSLEALKELKRLCDKHGLRYYLVAGTLLGAVRHGGFIPWDDDVDVAMPRSDYKRLESLAKKELSPNFFYQTEKTDKHSPFFFAKLRKDGTSVTEFLFRGSKMHTGCYVDIFPLDRCPSREKRARRFFKLTSFFTCALIAKTSDNFVCEYTKKGALFAFSVMKKLPRCILLFLRNAVRVYYTLTSSKKVICTVAGSYGYPRETYPSEWFDERAELKFEDEVFPVPKEYDKALTHMYGDYMTPPPENERNGHFIESNNE